MKITDWNIRKPLSWLTVTFVLALLISCSSKSEKAIVGKWEMSAMGISVTEIFSSDGSFLLITPDGRSQNGKWSIQKDKLTFEIEGQKNSVNILHLDDAVLVYQAPGAETSTFKRLK